MSGKQAVVQQRRRKPQVEVRTAILKSARREIEERGIHGMRVAEVAAGANVSLTRVYRLFEDREGLLVEVLGEVYQEFHDHNIERALADIPADGPLTVEIIANAFPAPMSGWSNRMPELRLAALAASVTNPGLKERLTRITESSIARWEAELGRLQSRLADGQRINPASVVMYFGLQNPYLWELMGRSAFDESAYREFLVRLLTS